MSKRPLANRTRIALLLASAALAAPAPGAAGVEFGFNEDWLSRPEALGLASDLGATLARFPGGWREVALGGFARFDRLYQEAAAQGIRLIWKEVNAPCFAHDGPCGATPATPPDAGHLDEFAEHLRAVVSRYPDLAAVEIGNEPNLPVFSGGHPDPAHYVRWLAAGYRAVKSVDPRLPVLFAGVAGTESSAGGKIRYVEFVRRAHELGAARFYDAMGFHPYPDPQDGPGYLADVKRKVATLKREMAAGGAPRKPIWITEVGLWTLAGGDEGVSAEVQAERIVAVYDELQRTPGVKAVIIHRLFDSPPGSGREAGWGVVGADQQSPKPAYCALGEARVGSTPPACLAGIESGARDPRSGDGWPWGLIALAAALLAAGVAGTRRLRFRRSRDHP